MLQDKSFCFHYMKGIHNISIFNDLNHSLRVEKQPKCLEKDHRLAGIGDVTCKAPNLKTKHDRHEPLSVCQEDQVEHITGNPPFTYVRELHGWCAGGSTCDTSLWIYKSVTSVVHTCAQSYIPQQPSSHVLSNHEVWKNRDSLFTRCLTPSLTHCLPQHRASA